MAGVLIQASAISDGDDRIVRADEAVTALQLRCGGEIPGTIAIPALLEIVRKARHYGLKLARTIQAHDGTSVITAWVEVEPRDGDEGGCLIRFRNWNASPLPAEDQQELGRRRAAIDRQVAELTARLDAGQRLLAVSTDAADLQPLAMAMQSGLGRPWTDFVEIAGSSHRQPLHWRLLDGAELSVPGSSRSWRASLFPHAVPGSSPDGFELCLTTREAAGLAIIPEKRATNARGRLVGRDVAPVLRQPIARIIANAETIRARLAGPLPDGYADYAADIAAAGQHLLALIEDLTDLEVVEADDFATTPDRIDLADVARKAAGILGVKARDRGIVIDAPRAGETLPAIAEFRRVLQILINLVGNAIRYSPANSQIWIRLEEGGGQARVIVADQGAGLSPEDQERVFEKFERLGRSGDGGSGLGLYISRRLARAMAGDLTIESAPGQGARFILAVPRGDSDEEQNSPLPKLPVRRWGTGLTAPDQPDQNDPQNR